MAAPKGHKRYGGRTKGQTNLATREREAAVAEALSNPSSDDTLSKRTLVKVIKHFEGLAAKHKAAGDEKSFMHCLKLAGDFAAKLMPFQYPTLQSVAVRQLPPLRPEDLDDDQLRAAIALESALTAAGGDAGRTLKTVN
jgi:hypothetical protein